MQTEVIIATYNNPRSLSLCLESIRAQTVLPHSIAFADDGSAPETRAIIDDFALPGVQIRHVWHEDQGFRKCEILNKAIASSHADYLIFLDGDVMIHPGFFARHLDCAERGRFMTGSLIRLDRDASEAVTPQMVKDGTVFDRHWLQRVRAIIKISTWLKTAPLQRHLLNLLELTSPVRRALCGANWSAFRSDILSVNGFDQQLAYGGEDKELGERLANSGIRGRHVRFTTPLIHLDHLRDYANKDRMRANKERIRQVRQTKVTWTDNGIAAPAEPSQQ